MAGKIPRFLVGIIILGILAVTLWFVVQNVAKQAPQSAQKPLTSSVLQSSMKKVSFHTSDGVNIVADYYPAAEPSGRGALLLHMMPATKESWREFAPKLVAAGYHVVAIDLRGHGASEGGPDGYRSFSDAEHQASIQDVEAAAEFLKMRGVVEGELVLIGASIGANLALWYLADHPETKKVVLLSPGLNYRSIATEPLMAKLKAGQRVMLVGSDDDPQSDGNVMRVLASKAPDGVKADVLVYKSAGHGTTMLGKEEPDLVEAILEWLPEI